MADLAVEVRRLRPEEAERYVAHRREMLIDTPWAYQGTPDDDSLLDADQVAKWCAHPEYGLFGAVDADGAILSSAGFFRDEPVKTRHKATIFNVYTTPAARGQGLARRVLELVLEHAAKVEGVLVAQLGVSETTPDARRLYERLGFEAWGREPRASQIDGVLKDEIHMWRAV